MLSDSKENLWKDDTICCTVETDPNDKYQSCSTPIYQSATFKQSSALGGSQYDYTRSGNPTRTVLELHLTKLMKSAIRSFVTSSGMTCLDVLLKLIPKHKNRVILGDDLYGGTNRLLNFYNKKGDITVTHLNTTCFESIKKEFTNNVGMVILESPTNPLMKVLDLPKLVSFIKNNFKDCLVVVDNTMLTPLNMSPLAFGADVEYHSGTKFLSGHHDLMAGVIAVKDIELANNIYTIINSTGVGLSPFDSFLLLRGVKTLSLRLEKQQSNTIKVAEFLNEEILPKYKKNFKVNFPGIKQNSNYGHLLKSYSKGFGAVLSFQTGCVEKSRIIVDNCKLFTISVSFGCINSLISMPCHMSHASIPAAVRKEREFPEDLVRLCIGIEDADDLIMDLKQSLELAGFC
ncbi:cystathionine beta-lyase [Lobulomyces angularis]|nr:cystathionine beta-lyase [Lobulomyces angularis]